MAYQYNVNPQPTTGTGPSGTVPGQIALPQPAQDLGAVYPNLSGSTAKTSGDIMSELRGELSPETLDNISNQAASFGVSSGMPLSGLSRSKQLESLGLTTEQLQHQGIGDFLAATPVVSKTQTVSPETEADIASRNALFAAAPSPSAAAGAQETAFNQAFSAAHPYQPPPRAGTTIGGPAVAGQGTRPFTPSAPPPGVVGPFGPGAGTTFGAGGNTGGTTTGGFSTVGGNPFALQPQGDLFGNVGNPSGTFNSGAAESPGYYPYGQNSGAGTTSFTDANGNPIAPPPAGSGNAAPLDDLANVYNVTNQNYTPQNDPWNFQEIND